MRARIFIFLALWLQFCGAKRAATRKRELLAEYGAVDESIQESGLLQATVTSATIFEKSKQWHSGSEGVKNTGPHTVLGYVTPWHRAGYAFSERFRAKFTHISPVWYQLRRQKDGSGEWALVGGHEHNQTWINAVRRPAEPEESCSVASEEREATCIATYETLSTKVVPRVEVEVDSAQDHLDLVRDPQLAIDAIVKEVEHRAYDGIVLEVWMTWVFMNGMANDHFRGEAFAFIQSLSSALRKLSPSQYGQKRELILAVPPLVPSAPSRPRTDPAHMEALDPFVDAWSIMTYDFSMGAGPQPNAPLTWLDANIQLLEKSQLRLGKALMGLNFYGYDFSKGVPAAITADPYLRILHNHQPLLSWKEELGEHSLTYMDFKNSKHTVFFPSPLSIHKRIEMFAGKRVGISIWELGQGLERWFDLF